MYNMLEKQYISKWLLVWLLNLILIQQILIVKIKASANSFYLNDYNFNFLYLFFQLYWYIFDK